MRKAFRSSGAKEYFPGKNKQHRFKNQFVNLPEGKDIVDVEVGEKGPTSDISLFREQQEKFHNNKMFEGDKGYQGARNISTPYKKPLKGELTLESKVGNKEFSTNGIFIE